MLGKGPVRALGAMSGTSMDGVDAAVLVTDGEAVFDFGPVEYRAYSEAERAAIRAALGQWPGGRVAQAADVVETAHTELLFGFADIDLIGFHGQTVAHEPQGRGTHQLGDGAALATALGRPVVWDFRTADVKLGGQGAPLAPFYHFACAKWLGAEAPVAFLNLGGVGNLTWVDPNFTRPEEDGALLAFDTGPANGPIDDLMEARFGQRYDLDGEVAANGTVDDAIVARFLEDGYFLRIPPKSLDRNDFPGLTEAVAQLPAADAAATLCACAVKAVARGLEQCPGIPERVLVTGGGRKNPVIMGMLAEALPCPVGPVEQVGLNGDMLEAQAFAYLAVRVARGLPTSCPGTTGVRAAVGGGMLSEP